MNLLKNPGFILRFAIAAGYIILGILLLINYKRVDFVNQTFCFLLAALLIIYGLFRGYRAYRYAKEESDE